MTVTGEPLSVFVLMFFARIELAMEINVFVGIVRLSCEMDLTCPFV
jgi:hypothetical protein